MGVDITMSIIKNKEYLGKDIFDGRDSEWFGNINDHYTDDRYADFPAQHGIPQFRDFPTVAGTPQKTDEVPEDMARDFCENKWYYGWHYMTVAEFKVWYDKRKPYLDAGWVTKREAWLYNICGIEPEEPQYRLYKENIPEDMVFLQIENRYEGSSWLYNYLMDNHIPNDAYIVYCFDC